VSEANYEDTLKALQRGHENCGDGKTYNCGGTTEHCDGDSSSLGSGDGESSGDGGSGCDKSSADGSGEDDEGNDDSSGDDDDDRTFVVTPKPPARPISGGDIKTTETNRVGYTTTSSPTTKAELDSTTTNTLNTTLPRYPHTFEEAKAKLLQNFSEV